MKLDTVELSRRYRSRYGALDNKRAQFIPVWTDIRNFLAPRTARFPGEMINKGQREDLSIINITPRLAIRTLAAGMQSGVTSPLRPWFRLGTPDPELAKFQPVKEWLYVVQQLMLEVFSKSNIYDRLKSNYSVLGSYGTSGFGIDEDDEDIIRAYDFPMGSFMIAAGASGRMNTLIRDVTLTATQHVEKFKKKAPQMARDAYDRGDYDNEYPCCQIIEPNQNYEIGSELSDRKRIASVWYDPGKSQNDDAILAYKGYNEMPVMAPRWDVLGEDTYGFGCGELALGDSKGLQLMEKRSYQVLDRYANPNWLADSSMRNERTQNVPGSTSYVNGLITGNPGYRPGYVIANPVFDKIDAKIQRTEEHINEAFFKNLFLMVSQIGDQPNITATQINTMREEKLLQMGPVLERLNDELLGPVIDRVFAIMYRRGMFPPPPKELQGMPLTVEYISVLAQAQKAMGLGNIDRMVQYIGGLALASQDMGVWDKYNKDMSIDEYADGLALNPKLILSDEFAAQVRQHREQMMKMQQAVTTADQIANTAKTASQIDTGGDNPIARMVQSAQANVH